MDLDALKEADNEGNSSEGHGAKSGSVEESENVDDDNRFTIYGTDGCLYYLSLKKGSQLAKVILGKEPLSMDIVLGADGTDIEFENVEIALRIREKEDHQFKVKAKERVTLEKETSARTMSTAGFQKGKSGGKGWNGGYTNHVGSEYAPEPVPLQQQHQPAFPQLMAAAWDQHIGSLCNVVIKNKFEALSVDDEESERKDKDNLERVVAACIEDPTYLGRS